MANTGCLYLEMDLGKRSDSSGRTVIAHFDTGNSAVGEVKYAVENIGDGVLRLRRDNPNKTVYFLEALVESRKTNR